MHTSAYSSNLLCFYSCFLGFRRVRRDGNCFYRAFLFSYLELVLEAFQQDDTKEKAEVELNRFRTVVVNSKDVLVNLGFSEFAFECFYDELIELLNNLPTMSSSRLYDSFQEGTGSPDEYTWFSRLLTSANMRMQCDRFIPFLDDTAALTGDMVSYLQREVEPMGKECEQVHIIALTDFVGVRCIIENLDGHNFEGALSVFDTNEGGDPAFTVTLLYRPGHYDCIYK